MRSRMVPLLPWMGIFFLAASCALLFPDRTAPKSSSYQVTPPEEPWHKLAVGNDSGSLDSMKADMAYENPESGAIISLNSLCRKYTDEPLQDLTNNLVRGIGKREVLSSAEREISGADALDTLFEGEVDGVKLHIRTVVLKKSDCTYDFIYVCIPRREGTSGRAFEKFLSSFRAD